MPKYYFDKNSAGEFCYPLDYFKVERRFSDGDIILAVAKRETGNGFFWCDYYNTCGEAGQSDCGTNCEAYKPRNNKTGRCRYSLNTFIPTDEFYKLTTDKKLIKIKAGEIWKLAKMD